MLYKFTTSPEIARCISIGIFRFYELTKYIKIEDCVGRADSNEGSLTFPEEEHTKHPEKLPTATFNGVEFKCISVSFNEEYIRQYFVFCMSTVMNASVIGDSTHVIELSEDIFETIEMLLSNQQNEQNKSGLKIFSHGPVEYYNINRHPTPYGQEKWREVYIKHSKFEHQHEYRSAIFSSDQLFETLKRESLVIARPIYKNGKRMHFDLKVSAASGTDYDGWRYIELDISEFAANLLNEPCKVTEVRSALHENG